MGFLILTLCCLGGQFLSARARFHDLRDAEGFFNDFMVKHNKTYKVAKEKNIRFEIFKKNLEYYNIVNEEHDAHVIGITKFSDMDREEFKRLYLDDDMKGDSKGMLAQCPFVEPDRNVHLDLHFDYRTHSMVTPVKHQGLQGSCTAFATTGNVEGQYAKVNHELVQFSEQQIIDCDSPYARFSFLKMEYLMNEGGSMMEEDYPYQQRSGICRVNPSKIVAKVTNCSIYDFDTEVDIQKILVTVGPLAIRICGDSLHGYHGGIYPTSVCKPGTHNHAVLLVGYGTANGKDYWLIKNSWGKDWGEHGYIRIERNTNACNIAGEGQIISSVVIAENPPGKRVHPRPTDKRPNQILERKHDEF